MNAFGTMAWAAALLSLQACGGGTPDASQDVFDSQVDEAVTDAVQPHDSSLADTDVPDDAIVPDAEALDTATDAAPPPAATWDPLPNTTPCQPPQRGLIGTALDTIGVAAADLGYDATSWGRSGYAAQGLLDDPALLAWQRQTLWQSSTAPCQLKALTADIDHALDAREPVAHAIRVAATRLGRWPAVGPRRTQPASASLADAIARCCAAPTAVATTWSRTTCTPRWQTHWFRLWMPWPTSSLHARR